MSGIAGHEFGTVYPYGALQLNVVFEIQGVKVRGSSEKRSVKRNDLEDLEDDSCEPASFAVHLDKLVREKFPAVPVGWKRCFPATKSERHGSIARQSSGASRGQNENVVAEDVISRLGDVFSRIVRRLDGKRCPA